jgi:hypothetical protein
VVAVSVAVEGSVDEAIVRRLILESGGTPGPVYGKNGKASLKARIKGYNNSAKYRPWVVLVDLDHEADCAPDLCAIWLPQRSQKMCFRVAVREVEAWLLADRERLAKFLSVALTKLPATPESEDDPKQLMVSLAAHSKRKGIREDMVPRHGSGRYVGPAYTSRLMEFVGDPESGWRPNVAAQSSDSLRRCLESLRALVLM